MQDFIEQFSDQCDLISEYQEDLFDNSNELESYEKEIASKNIDDFSIKMMIDSFLTDVTNNGAILKNHNQEEGIEEELIDTWEQFQFRDYQLDMYNRAKGKNSIIYLETGLGKTLVIIMLMWDRIMKFPDKKVIFLANTIQLVEQQATQISSKIPRVAELLSEDENFVKYAIQVAKQVQVIHGDKCVDLWNPQMWQFILSENKIFVMTAQVFLNILRKGLIKLSEFCFIAMDECHAAQQSHQYNFILQEFYFPLKSQLFQKGKQNEVPQIVGATASPIVNNKTTSTNDIHQDLLTLAANLDSVYLDTDERGASIYLNQALIEVVPYKLLFTDPRIINLINCYYKSQTQQQPQSQPVMDFDPDDEPDPEDKYDDVDYEGPPSFSSVLRSSKYIEEFFVLKDRLQNFKVTHSQDLKIAILISQLQRILIVNGLQMYLELGKYVMLLLLQDIITKLKEYNNLLSIQKEENRHLEQLIENLEAMLYSVTCKYSLLETSASPKVVTLLNKIKEIYQSNQEATVLIFVKQRISACYLHKIIEAYLMQSNINIKSEFIIGHVFRKIKTNQAATELINDIADSDLQDEEELMKKLEKELQKDLTKFNISEFKDQISKLSIFSQKVSAKEQKEILQKFRSGQIKILISTSVAEEGIDIPICNYVIGFHPITSSKAYVQMKGRARKPGSKFLIFTAEVTKITKSNTIQHQQVQSTTKNIIQQLTRQYGFENQIQQLQRKLEESTFYECFTIEESGALFNTNWSLSLIQQFFQTYLLGSDSKATPKYAIYRLSNKSQTNIKYFSFLLLPLNSQECIFRGQQAPTSKEAKASSALKAAMWLFEQGYIDSNLKFCLNSDLGQHIGADQDDSQIMMTKKQFQIAKDFSIKIIRNKKNLNSTLSSQLRYFQNYSKEILASKEIPNSYYEYDFIYEQQSYSLVFTNTQLEQIHGIVEILAKFNFEFNNLQQISKECYYEDFSQYLRTIYLKEGLEQVEGVVYQKVGTNLYYKISNAENLNVIFVTEKHNNHSLKRIFGKIILAIKVTMFKEKLEKILPKDQQVRQIKKIKAYVRYNVVLEALHLLFSQLMPVKLGMLNNSRQLLPLNPNYESFQVSPSNISEEINFILYRSLDLSEQDPVQLLLGEAYLQHLTSMQIYAGFFAKDIKIAQNKFKVVTRPTFVRNYLLELQIFLYLQQSATDESVFRDYSGFEMNENKDLFALSDLLNQNYNIKQYNLTLQTKTQISNSDFINFLYTSLACIQIGDVLAINGFKWLRTLGLSQTIKQLATSDDLLQLFPYGAPDNYQVKQIKECYARLEETILYQFQSFQLFFQAMTDSSFRQVVNNQKLPKYDQPFNNKESNTAQISEYDITNLTNLYKDLNNIDSTNFTNTHLAFLGKYIWKLVILKILISKNLNFIQTKVCQKILTGNAFLSILSVKLNIHQYLNCSQENIAKEIVDFLMKNKTSSMGSLVTAVSANESMKLLSNGFLALNAAIFMDQNCDITFLHKWIPLILEKCNCMDIINDTFLVWQPRHRFLVWYEKKFGNPVDFNLIKIPHQDYKKTSQGEYLYLPYDVKKAEVIDLFQDKFSDISQLHFYAKSKEKAYAKLFEKIL